MTPREYLEQHVPKDELDKVHDPELDLAPLNGETPAQALITFISWIEAPQGWRFWADEWSRLVHEETLPQTVFIQVR